MTKTFCDFFVDFMQIYSLDPLFMKKVEQKGRKIIKKRLSWVPKSCVPYR